MYSPDFEFAQVRVVKASGDIMALELVQWYNTVDDSQRVALFILIPKKNVFISIFCDRLTVMV